MVSFESDKKYEFSKNEEIFPQERGERGIAVLVAIREIRVLDYLLGNLRFFS